MRMGLIIVWNYFRIEAPQWYRNASIHRSWARGTLLPGEGSVGGVCAGVGRRSFSHPLRLFISPHVWKGVAPMATGKVKWFNDQKGFGFIAADNGKDVFVHHSVIDGQGFRTLQENETVEYEYEDGPKGM